MLPHLAEGSPEQQAIDAGEIDAVIDHSSGNVILLPLAKRALRKVADRALASGRQASSDATIANRLLAALPRLEYQRLFSDFEPLTLRLGAVLHEPRVPIRHVYFPIDCAISMQATAENGQALEVELIGREGMAGIALALGVDSSCVRAVVRIPGTAMRMTAAAFNEALRHCLPLQRELYRYAHAKLASARQAVACKCFHTTAARLACRLLTTSDCVRSEVFVLTQADLAKALGVRRATVNEAAGPLQQRELISYRRGSIRILDRKGLEAAACRCYASI